MTAALNEDKAAVDKVEAALAESIGKEFPGSHVFWNFRANIEAPVTLDDFVAQSGKKMLIGDKPPPPMRAKENWSRGCASWRRRAPPISCTKSCFPGEMASRPLERDFGEGHILPSAHRGQCAGLARSAG